MELWVGFCRCDAVKKVKKFERAGPEQRVVSIWPLSPQSLPSNVHCRRAHFVERARARPRARTSVFWISVKSSQDRPNHVRWLYFLQLLCRAAKSAPEIGQAPSTTRHQLQRAFAWAVADIALRREPRLTPRTILHTAFPIAAQPQSSNAALYTTRLRGHDVCIICTQLKLTQFSSCIILKNEIFQNKLFGFICILCSEKLCYYFAGI